MLIKQPSDVLLAGPGWGGGKVRAARCEVVKSQVPVRIQQFCEYQILYVHEMNGFLCMLPYMLNPGAVLLVKDIFNARCEL